MNSLLLILLTHYMRLVMLENSYIKQPLRQSFNDPNGLAKLSYLPSTQQFYQTLTRPNLNMDFSTLDQVSKQSKINSLNANQNLLQKKRQKLNNTFSTIGQGADILGSLLPQNSAYSGSYGGITQGLDTAYNQASNYIMSVNPLVGGIMKTGSFVNKGLNALGIGTDGQTATDAILGSSFLGLTPIGLTNSLFGRKTHTFNADNDAIAQVGGDYQGSVSTFQDAASKSNKKYGLFSGGARRKANRLIDNAQQQMDAISSISDKARRVLALDGMANYQKYQLDQNGGPQAMYIAAKGTKLRIKKICSKIHKKLKGGIIEPKQFIPVITLTNTIKLQQGGNVIPANRTIEQLIAYAKEVNPRFIQRMSEPLRYITLPDGQKATHKMSWATAEFDGKEKPFIYSQIQENDKGELQDFGDQAIKRALDKKNYLLVNSPEEAELFTNSNDLQHGYKQGWKEFFTPFYKEGGVAIKITIVKDQEEPKEKENSEKNVIPEGALHAHKHNIENTDSLTQKGIPVVDDKGEQQAEIEKDEIILNLKLTNKLEELQSKYEKASKKEQDNLAIEAGKLLVQEILHNTIDNTGLIDKCQKGGKINDSK